MNPERLCAFFSSVLQTSLSFDCPCTFARKLVAHRAMLVSIGALFVLMTADNGLGDSPVQCTGQLGLIAMPFGEWQLFERIDLVGLFHQVG